MFRVAWILALLGAAGCGEVVSLDAGAQDAGPLDVASTEDAGPPDTGIAQDSGVHPDAEIFDATVMDAQPPDATLDAGPRDAEVDAGARDAEVDAGPARVQVSLVFVGDGEGMVRWPDGTNCIADCTRTFDTETPIELTAVPASSAVFAGWSANECSGLGTCSVVLTQDRSIEVRFEALYDVVVTPQGPGLGRIDGLGAVCIPSCATQRLSGTVLSLTAIPAAGVRFAGWTGDCSGTTPACALTVDGAKNLLPNWEVVTPQIGQSPGGHFCALVGPRSVRCWGHGGVGQLGRDSIENVGDDELVASIGDVPLGLDVVQIAMGGTHTCVLTKAGAVRCWGLNAEGQLGRGDTTSVGDGVGPSIANSIDVDLGGPAMQITLGAWHSCARMATGAVRCWGRGIEGQLGYGSPFNLGNSPTSLPARNGDMALGDTAISIAAGNTHTCAILSGGGVRCWGDNSSGQLGYPFSLNVGDGNGSWPTPASAPVLPLGADPVEEVRGGVGHTCVRHISGVVRCWGANVDGQLGDGSSSSIGGPMGRTLSAQVGLVGLPEPAISLAVGALHTCVLLSDRTVRCWGQAMHGQTGYETSLPRNTPGGAVELPATHRIVGLGIVGVATCAVSEVAPTFTAHAISCWGLGRSGALGTGLGTNVGDLLDSMPPADSPVF